MFVDIAHRDNFGRVAGYAGRLGARLILSSLASRQPFWMSREFDAVAALCPKVQKPAVHIVLTPPKSAEFSDYQFRLVTLWLCKRIGLDGRQLVAWRHDDAAHSHVHVLANRVSPMAEVSSLWLKGQAIRRFQEDVQRIFYSSDIDLLKVCVQVREVEASVLLPAEFDVDEFEVDMWDVDDECV